MNRREFIKTTVAVVAGVMIPLPAFAKRKSGQDDFANWLHRKPDNYNEVLGSIPPIQIYCLGSNYDPARSEDITQVMAWIDRQNSSLPKDTTAVSSITPVHHGNSTYGRIPVQRNWQPKDFAYAKLYPNHCRPDSIACRYYTVYRPGEGFLEVRIGSDARPAQKEDLEDITRFLSDTLADTELAIVTHHNFEMKWFETPTLDKGYDWSRNMDAVIMPHNGTLNGSLEAGLILGTVSY